MVLCRVLKGVSLSYHDPDFDPATDLVRWLRLCDTCSNDLKSRNHKQSILIYTESNKVRYDRYPYDSGESELP